MIPLNNIQTLSVLQIFYAGKKIIEVSRCMEKISQRIKIQIFTVKIRAPVQVKQENAQISQQIINRMQLIFSGILAYNSTLDDEIIKECFKIEEWRCLTLTCLHSQILKNQNLFPIRHISFSQLQILFISRCNLQTIEHLASIRAPHLKQIRLHHNKLVSLSPLIKIQSSEIRDLYIHTNCVKEFDRLAVVNWPQFSKIFIDFSYNTPSSESINAIARLPRFPEQRVMCCGARKRIKQLKSSQVLAEKGIKIDKQ